MRALNVSDFGAAGDGATDDSTAILAAIAQAAEQHAAVAFDAKTYNVSREIRLTGQAALLGMPPVNGKSTVIRAGTPGMRAVVSLIGAHTVRDVTFDASRLATHAIYFQGCSNSVFERVGAMNALRDGVYLSGETDGSLPWTTSNRYGLGARVHDGGNVYECIAPPQGGESGDSGPGLAGTGNAIADGTVVWRYVSAAMHWTPLTQYLPGSLVQNGTSVYECTGAGTSAAAGGPSGTAPSIADGSVTWRFMSAASAYAINDTNVWTGSGTAFNGSAWVTPALDREVTQNPDSAGYFIEMQRTLLSGATASVTERSNRITFTGLDLFTFALRAGDFIRVGIGARKRMTMILDVPTTANEVLVDTLFDFSASGLEFAILSGDGYREEHHGDNNFNSFHGGLYRGNVGAAFAFNGLYGGALYDPQVDFNAYGVRAGGIYGANGCNGGLVSHGYFEQMHSGKPFKLVSAQNWVILAPVDSDGDATANIDPADAINSVGLYVNKDGMYPIGRFPNFRSHVPSTLLFQARSEFGFTLVPREFGFANTPEEIVQRPGYMWNPAHSMNVSGANIVELRLNGQHRTISATPAIGPEGGRLQVIGVHRDEAPYTLTLQDEAVSPGSRLKLRTRTATLSAGECILFYGNGLFWYELGRWGAYSDLTATDLIARGSIQFQAGVTCTNKGDSTAAPGDATLHTGAGRSTIQAREDSCVIGNDKVSADSIVLLSWEADPGSTWWVVPAAGRFTVRLRREASTSTAFRWFVVT